jgi:hypothetical protein
MRSTPPCSSPRPLLPLSSMGRETTLQSAAPLCSAGGGEHLFPWRGLCTRLVGGRRLGAAQQPRVEGARGLDRASFDPDGRANHRQRSRSKSEGHVVHASVEANPRSGSSDSPGVASSSGRARVHDDPRRSGATPSTGSRCCRTRPS